MLIMQASAKTPTMASSREKFFWSGIWIYSLATGLASMIFMAWAFYVESIEGRGALFIEPNRVLAAGGLVQGPTGPPGLFDPFLPRRPPPLHFLPRGFCPTNISPHPHSFSF